MITVRDFSPGRAREVAILPREMEDFYGTAVSDDTDVEGDVCNYARVLDLIVALHDDRVVGFAFFALLYPSSGLTSALHLKQLYVAKAARHRGVGKILLSHVARAARERGCPRVEWTTGLDNHAARALYDGIGAASQDKVKYTLDGSSLAALAQ